MSANTLSGLHNLYSLSLSRNKISSLPPHWLHHSVSLVRLDLSHNRISNLPSHSFADCSQLSSLDLSDNRLGSLAPAAGNKS